MPPTTPSRRRLLGLAVPGGATLLTGLLSGSLAGCHALSTEPAGQRAGAGRPVGSTTQRESPDLAARVRGGHLPKLAQRLPRSPLVVETAELGTYGGTWHAAMLGPQDTSWLDRSAGYEMLLRWKAGTRSYALDEITPNVAASYEASRDGRHYDIHLRPDHKWSDGHEFGADDLVFAVRDVFLDKTLFPVPPAGLLSGGRVGTITKVDDTTVRFSFEVPSALFPYALASKNLGLLSIAAYPAHYLRRFHGTYASSPAKNWPDVFAEKADVWNNPDLPSLHAWVPEHPLNKGSTYAMRRNPYYWKVDSKGRQLPYLETFENQIISDQETIVLRILHGDVDFYDRMVNTMANKPVFARSRDVGSYRFTRLVNGNMNAAFLALNLTHKDPAKRRIFTKLDFRIGLSHALNRPEIIDTVYQGQLVPWQVAPLRESTYFDERLATQYLEYDVAKANRHLDAAGFGDRDPDGLRLDRSGRPIRFTVDVSDSDYGFSWVDVMELVKKYWRAVGIDIVIKNMSGALFVERYSANEHEATIAMGDAGGLDPHLMPTRFMPYVTQTYYAVEWAKWYESRGAEGERPPAATRHQMRLYDTFKTTMDQAGQKRLMSQILRIAAEQFYNIGIGYPKDRYAMRRNDFRNVPAAYLESSNYPNPGPTNPEQYYVAGGSA